MHGLSKKTTAATPAVSDGAPGSASAIFAGTNLSILCLMEHSVETEYKFFNFNFTLQPFSLYCGNLRQT